MRYPAAARPPITVVPVQPGLGWAATPTGLTITTMSSSSWTISMPSTGSATICTGAGGLRASRPPARRRRAPARTCRPPHRRPGPCRRRPARRPWCGRNRTSGRWRRRHARLPGRRVRAGCGSRECVLTCRVCLAPGLPRRPVGPVDGQSLCTVPSGSRPLKERSTIRMPPQTIAESARLKTAKCAGAMKSTTAPFGTRRARGRSGR